MLTHLCSRAQKSTAPVPGLSGKQKQPKFGEKPSGLGAIKSDAAKKATGGKVAAPEEVSPALKEALKQGKYQ
jgi:hypothetical protein